MVRHRILLGVFALAIGTGTTWASNKSLALSLGSGTLACNTNTGGTGSALLTVTGSTTATYPLTVSLITFTNPGLTVTASNGNGAQLTSSASKVTYTVAPTANCSGFTGTYTSNSDAWSTTITSSYNATADATQAVTVTETDTAATPLSTSAGTVNISCILNPGGTYTAGSTQFYLYTAAAIGSAATFSTLPPWLTLNGSASAGPFTVPFAGGLQMTAAVSAGACATIGGLGSSKSTSGMTIGTALPEPANVTLPITIQGTIVGPAPLSVTGTPAYGSSSTPLALTPYTRGSGASDSGSVTLTSANPVYFTVDMTTMPNWLTVSSTSGQITTQNGTTTLQFSVTKVADTLTPGTYTTGVNGIPAISLKVAGYFNTSLYVSLVVQNTAPTLSLQGGATQNLSWNPAISLPTATITLVSNGALIAFTASAGNTNGETSFPAGAVVTPAAGLAYSFGTSLGVTFTAANFAAAAPGSTLYSTVTIGWGTGQTILGSAQESVRPPGFTGPR